jgi:glycosyltransferase involved in cell wall biosynthesis
VPARWLTWLWHRLHVPLPVEAWAGQADLMHATDFLAPPTRRARPVVTVHDLSFLVVPERAEPTLARYLAARVGPAVAGAAAVLADSENTRRDVLSRLAVDPSRVHVALPGVDAERYVVDEAERARVRAAHGLRRPFVLGVGTLEPRKDWPTLVAAFEAAALEGFELVLAGGRGWRMEALDAALRTTRAPVRCLGFVPDEDLPGLVSAARAFAYPSVYEGFGLPPLEAMAAGTPTAVADVSSLPEVVGDAALRLPAGDVSAWAQALREMTLEGALRERLVAAGPRQAARFTWESCARAVEAGYAAAGHAAAGRAVGT